MIKMSDYINKCNEIITALKKDYPSCQILEHLSDFRFMQSSRRRHIAINFIRLGSDIKMDADESCNMKTNMREKIIEVLYQMKFLIEVDLHILERS